jgi:heme exporter protein A
MLEALELHCERGSRTLFRNLSFQVGPGEALRIAGANGSGKTSLLRILCGLLAASAGEVRWKGEGIGRLREDYARELLYLGHAAAVKDDLTAVENLSIACAIAGDVVGGESVRAALARLQVPDSAPVRRLSQGQRRRAALARLVVSESRPLWLLDEPFTALDAQGIAVLRHLVEQHASRGGAVVFSTHQDAGTPPTRVIELG